MTPTTPSGAARRASPTSAATFGQSCRPVSAVAEVEVHSFDAPGRAVVRVEIPSGRRTTVRELHAVGPVGGAAGGIGTVRLSADANTIAYTVNRYFSELMVIEGLR